MADRSATLKVVACIAASWLAEAPAAAHCAIAAATTVSIAHLKISGAERAGQRAAVAATKAALREAGLPLLATETHIVPVMVGDPDLCKQASDLLLDRHGIYIQPINYPTVPRGTERLRITPTPAHDARLIGQLADAMVSVWRELNLPLGGDYQPAEQRPRTVAAGG